MLRGVTIRFDTHDDAKDEETVVHVFIRNRWSNSLTPQKNTDFITNWFALNQYLPAGPPRGQQNPYIAYKLFIGADDHFDAPSSRSFELDLAPPQRGVDDVILPEVSIHILTDKGVVVSGDRWIFDYTVTIHFDEASYRFSSTDDGVRGIILDQDNPNYTRIGKENPLRTTPPLEIAKADTDAVLREVTLEFATRAGDDNNKDSDTRLNVHIVNRLSAFSAQDIAVGLDLFHDQEFPDSGPREDLYRKFIWSAHDNTLASKAIRLADMILPMVYISIAPNGDDTWDFDYRVTFEFGHDHIPNEKRYVYSWRSDGIVLDQDNPKHAGIYQGPPFPTVTPASAPALTYHPVDRTGDNKKRIFLAYLRRRLDDFINNRTGIPTIDPNPPLWRIELGSTPFDEDYPLPESYYDLQSLVNDNGGGVDYVSSPGSLHQIVGFVLGIGDTYIKRVEGESIKLEFSYQSFAPFVLTLTFKAGGVLEIADVPGDTFLDTFYVTIALTLDVRTIVDPVTTKTRSTVDLFSWMTELQDNQFDPVTGHYTGTFLHRPVDYVYTDHPPAPPLSALLEAIESMLREMVITVHLVTDSAWDPGGVVRSKIAGAIYDELTKTDVITNRSRRDDVNSLATSWLLGGVADDEQNTDENNTEIENVEFEGGWSRPWATIAGLRATIAAPTAITRTSDHVDLFVTGDDGRIYTTYRDGAGPWAAWLPISPSFVNAAQPVTVLARTPDHMDLFAAGSDGKVYTSYWDSGTTWSTDPWMAISPAFVEKVPVALTAIARPVDHMDVFASDSTGYVEFKTWDNTEDAIVLSYKGPKNIFVAKPPMDWPAAGLPSTAYDFSPSTLWNIDHIVVLTKENRSFDHVLGYLSLPFDKGGMGRTEVDGLTGTEFNAYKGTNYYVKQLNETLFAPGPPNAYEAVEHAIDGGKMDGFVRSHAELNSDEVAGEVMGYHTAATVPVYDALARDFAIGHRWFASHPGPTYPNRFYELTGRPNLDPRGFWEFHNASSKRPVFSKTIFDYLDGAVDPKLGTPITWRYFEDGVCTLRFFEKYTFDHDRIVDFGDPENGFLACARAGRLPSISFIDPHVVDLAPGSNCDEPPSDMAHGQELAQRVVEAVVSGPAWTNTLLLIVYDEHGGFYDHVPPPQAAKVSEEFPIETFGVRVPVFVISPWVAAGSVFGSASDPKQFDHTSILKTIVRRFLPDNPPYLGARYAAANDLSVVIGNQPHQPQFLPFITYRLQFVASQLLLTAIQLPTPDPGAVAWQAPVDGTVMQDFSFEDAGDGFVYIRSHMDNVYLAAQAAESVRTSRATASPGAKWKLSPTGSSILDRNLYVISNQDYPNTFLQPASRTSKSPLVLGDVGGSVGTHGAPPNAWRISSPSIS